MNQDSEINAGSADVFDGSAPDLGSASDEFDPFGDTDFADEPATEIKEPQKPKDVTTASKANAKAASAKAETIPANPLEKAMDAAESKEALAVQKDLFSKLPVFSYAAASEDVDDTSKTFEDLRIEKSTDFPELEDGKRVSWTVEYGKVTKVVSDPKSITIAKIKTEIETSKEFLDALKKSKEKEPICKLKPKVTAQSKGKVCAYKGVFISMEDAVASGKMISLFPAKDGKVYEMRRNEMGTFITPAAGSDMLSDVTAGFIPALPLIPHWHLLDIIRFFKLMAMEGDYEALVNIYWDKQAEEFITDVPKQTVTQVSVNSEPNPEYDSDRYIHYMDIHSHNRMKAFFSPIDNRDEKATRIYAVIGNIHGYLPEIKMRISNGGAFLGIDPGLIFEDFDCNTELVLSWFGQVGKIPVHKHERAANSYPKLINDSMDSDME